MSKKILISGCSSGFGLDAAKTLARKGHHVYATMRAVDGRNAHSAQELRDFAASAGVSISVHEMDVTSDESVANAVADMDGVDVLINNAGYGYGGPVESFEGDEILAQLDLNIVGTARTAAAVLPGMKALVVDVFDRLIDTPKGQRPIRTIVGLDFGFQAMNDASDPIRKASLESMGLSELDGPQA